MRTLILSGRIGYRLQAGALLAALSVAFTGCAARLIQEKQTPALKVAVTRGQKDLACQEVVPEITSREVGQPSISGTWVEGQYRAEFWIRVDGCGKQNSYYIICPEPDLRCFAVGPGGLAQWE
jgi:hypothetical protein